MVAKNKRTLEQHAKDHATQERINIVAGIFDDLVRGHEEATISAPDTPEEARALIDDLAAKHQRRHIRSIN